MRRNKTKKTKLVALLLILVLLISVGYAALTTNLQINGTATVKHQSWNVHFTNIVVDTANNNVKTVDTAPVLSNNDTTVTWGVSMDTPGQVYKFNVDVINEGSMDAMVNTATNSIVTSALTEAQQEYLDYTITYSDGAAIEQYDKLSAGDTVTLTIKLLYKNDDSVNPNELPQTAQNGIRLSYTAEYVQADTTNAKARTKYLSGATIKVDGTAVGNETVTVIKGDTSTISIDNSQGMEDITYASSDATVATVNSSGVITGVELGTATITLTGETSGKTKTIEVTVQAPRTTINVGGTDIDLNTLNQSTVGQYYGTTVATVNGVNYGLYYVDYAGDFGEEGTVYLKALSSVGNITLNSVTESANAIEIMKDLNPKWATNRGTTEFSSYTTAEKGTMYLCNPAVTTWSGIQTAFEAKYGAENVNYVIGGPSVELLMASYNSKVSPSPVWKTKWFAAEEEKFYPGYLYSIDNGMNYATNYNNAISTVDGMYRSNSYKCWLASPLSNDYDYMMCSVDQSGSLTSARATFVNADAVTPLVSLKSGVNLTE